MSDTIACPCPSPHTPWSGCIHDRPRRRGMTAVDVTSPTLPAMAKAATEAPPTNETLERVLKTEPLKVLDRLPDCIERREAERLVNVVDDLAHRAHERIRPE
jgi:hypothetical protein